MTPEALATGELQRKAVNVIRGIGEAIHDKEFVAKHDDPAATIADYQTRLINLQDELGGLFQGPEAAPDPG